MLFTLILEMRAYAFVTNARELTQLKNRRFLSFLDIKCSQKATLVQGTTSIIDLKHQILDALPAQQRAASLMN